MRAGGFAVKSQRAAATYANLYLLGELIKRDFRARFTGSALGLAWAVLQPLSLVALYWFVFSFMIPRVTTPGDRYIDFLIAGLLPWLGISEGVMRATTSIVDNAAVVRKLPLRSELLVFVPNVTAIIFQSIGMAIFVVSLVVRDGIPQRLWLLPMAIVLQLLVQTGAGLLLAAIYVFFRDLTQMLGFVLSIIFYLSPILYRPSGRFAAMFEWNPMTPLLGLFRSALLPVALPPAQSIVFLLVVVAGMLAAGLSFFRRARPGLVDLI
jgi:lipopolysaccharide transport system permease protein